MEDVSKHDVAQCVEDQLKFRVVKRPGGKSAIIYTYISDNAWIKLYYNISYLMLRFIQNFQYWPIYGREYWLASGNPFGGQELMIDPRPRPADSRDSLHQSWEQRANVPRHHPHHGPAAAPQGGLQQVRAQPSQGAVWQAAGQEPARVGPARRYQGYCPFG